MIIITPPDCAETLTAKLMQLPDGTRIVVRQICAGDTERLRRMFDRLSPLTVYRRFFSPITRPRQSMLRHLATVDHERREAIVALAGDEIIGVARYDATAPSGAAGGSHATASQPGAERAEIWGDAEIAVTVEDAWQHRGLGTLLLRRLTKVALSHGYDHFSASMLADNRPALSLLHQLAPGARVALDSGSYEATIDLRRGTPTSAGASGPVGEAVHEAQA
jgi:GNAT superfamily N-acetyltransferase